MFILKATRHINSLLLSLNMFHTRRWQTEKEKKRKEGRRRCWKLRKVQCNIAAVIVIVPLSPCITATWLLSRLYEGMIMVRGENSICYIATIIVHVFLLSVAAWYCVRHKQTFKTHFKYESEGFGYNRFTLPTRSFIWGRKQKCARENKAMAVGVGYENCDVNAAASSRDEVGLMEYEIWFSYESPSRKKFNGLEY